jgi:CBS domain-containing protein
MSPAAPGAAAGPDANPAATPGLGDDGPLRGLAGTDSIVVPPSATLRDLLYQISQSREDAVVVVDEATRLPLGLVTLRALLHAITLEGGSLDDPVAVHMIGAPLTIAADAPPHRAKVLMAKRGADHVLLVERDGSFSGLVAQTDLLGLRAGGAKALIAAIAAARDVQTMALVADRVRRRGAELFAAGMGAEALSRWMSGLNDLITIRIIEVIEDEFDLPGVAWGWMLFGSEGRLEQTFATDQDNGLIFAPADPAETEQLRAAFVPFAQAVNEALHHCGFERCRGGIMAGNPQWCLSLDEWRMRFSDWLSVPDPQALLHGTIFFDFRPLYGGFELVDELRGSLTELVPERPRFLRALAENALAVAPPLGLAGQFVYDRNRDFPHTIDLKLRGARLFVDAARVWGLGKGLWATSTAERLRGAGRAGARSEADIAADIEAFHIIQRFRIQQQLSSRHPDRANRLDPADLGELHRLMLKEAFRQAKKLQLRLRQEFQL